MRKNEGRPSQRANDHYIRQRARPQAVTLPRNKNYSSLLYSHNIVRSNCTKGDLARPSLGLYINVIQISMSIYFWQGG